MGVEILSRCYRWGTFVPAALKYCRHPFCRRMGSVFRPPAGRLFIVKCFFCNSPISLLHPIVFTKNPSIWSYWLAISLPYPVHHSKHPVLSVIEYRYLTRNYLEWFSFCSRNNLPFLVREIPRRSINRMMYHFNVSLITQSIIVTATGTAIFQKYASVFSIARNFVKFMPK